MEKDNFYNCGGVGGAELCPYFHPTSFKPVVAGGEAGLPEPIGGECRFNPPKLMTIPVRVEREGRITKPGDPEHGALEMRVVGAFPPVEPDAFCAKHPVAVADSMLDVVESIAPELYRIGNEIAGGSFNVKAKLDS